MTLGVVSTGSYYYRRRSVGISSAIENSRKNANWYIPYLEYFIKHVYDYNNKQFGYVPSFIQYSLMYDLQWKVKQGKIPQNVLIEKEEKRYYKLLLQLISQFDDKIILEQKNCANRV